MSLTTLYISAILELFHPVDFFHATRPICLPHSHSTIASALLTGSYNFDDAEIAGWGWAGEDVNVEGSLRAVNTKIWPQYFCEDVIDDAPGIFQRNVKPSGSCTLFFEG